MYLFLCRKSNDSLRKPYKKTPFAQKILINMKSKLIGRDAEYLRVISTLMSRNLLQFTAADVSERLSSSGKSQTTTSPFLLQVSMVSPKTSNSSISVWPFKNTFTLHNYPSKRIGYWHFTNCQDIWNPCPMAKRSSLSTNCLGWTRQSQDSSPRWKFFGTVGPYCAWTSN